MKAVDKKPSQDSAHKIRCDNGHYALKSTHPIYLNPQVSIIQLKPFCPCGGGCPRCSGSVQAKLKIGQPNDICEQEADRIADQVMRMPEPAIQPKAT